MPYKVYWFFTFVCNPRFAAFWCFAAGQHVNGGSIAIIDLFLAFIDYWNIIIDFLSRAQSRLRHEFNVCVPLQKMCHCLQVFSFPAWVCLIVQSSIQNDCHRRPTYNTRSYSISSKGEQLLIIFPLLAYVKKISPVSIPVESTIPWAGLKIFLELCYCSIVRAQLLHATMNWVCCITRCCDVGLCVEIV